MNRYAAFATLLSSQVAFASAITGAPLSGTLTPVNTSNGEQADPHVSATVVAYTDAPANQIRYLLAGTDQAIPQGASSEDRLSDVSGSRIVFSRLSLSGGAIFSFDTATATLIELAPGGTPNRDSAAIGNDTVAWLDFSFGRMLTTDVEVIAYDFSSATSQRLTNDAFADLDPAVSPDGNMIAWVKCTGLFGSPPCDVNYSIRNGGGNWNTSALAIDGDESEPDTTGSLLVYASTRAGSTDIYWRTITAGGGVGAEQHLDLPGQQKSPAVSGSLIAFETTVASGNTEIGLYDTATNTFYNLTHSDQNERLTDIFVSGTNARVVWTRFNAVTGEDVYLYTFTVPTGCTPSSEDSGCDDPGTRPLLATLQLNRTPGKPNTDFASFASSTHGLLCMDNGFGGRAATSGQVSLNAVVRLGPDSFKKQVAGAQQNVELGRMNTVSGRIAGAPGSAYRVRIYGEPRTCSTSTSSPLELVMDTAVPFAIGSRGAPSTAAAEPVSVEKNIHRLVHPMRTWVAPVPLEEKALLPPTGGCSSAGESAAVAAFLALIGVVALRRGQRLRFASGSAAVRAGRSAVNRFAR